MVEHTREEQDEAQFYPVDGLRGNCKCGAYLHYTDEGSWECDGEEGCGRVWNIYVDCELWQEP